MKKGKLSTIEKYAIQQLIHQGKELKDIQTELDRPNSIAVKNYVNIELEKLHDTITKVRIAKEPASIINVHEEIVIAACHKLVKDGLSLSDAENIVNATIKTLDKTPNNVNDLYISAIKHRQSKVKHYMVTKTEGGNEGVAIMTSPASMRGDEKNRSAQSRTSRGAIWNPKQNKMSEE